MPVTELNHYLLRANDLERTKDFYVNVLGFEVMPRPNFPFPGYWLGINGKIQVHMGQAGVPNSELYYLGSPKNAAKNNSGVIDHIAFLATEPEKFIDHLKANGRSHPPSQLARVEALPALHPGPGRSHDRAQFLRRASLARVGRRGLFEDAARPVQGQSQDPAQKRQSHAAMNAPRQGFAGVAYEEAMRRARELAPKLRERAAEAETARVLSPETLRDLHSTGLFRTLQPKRWGGMEFDFIAYVDFPLELACGCPSTAWNLANLQVHHWMLAMYDERAQEEVWGRNPEAMIASGIAYPQGQGRRVDGGFTISGRWNFSSCVNVADWNMLAVTVREGERVIGHRMCLLHKSQYEVVDDWKVLGMRATGSMTVLAKDVFVPEYKALDMYEARGGTASPGARANPQSRLPGAALGARRSRHRRLCGRQRAGGARAHHRLGQGAQHQLHRDEDARFPDGAAAHRRCCARRSTRRA